MSLESRGLGCGLRGQLSSRDGQHSPERCFPPTAPTSALLRAFRSSRKQPHPLAPSALYVRPSRPHPTNSGAMRAPGDLKISNTPRHLMHAHPVQPTRRIRAERRVRGCSCGVQFARRCLSRGSIFSSKVVSGLKVDLELTFGVYKRVTTFETFETRPRRDRSRSVPLLASTNSLPRTRPISAAPPDARGGGRAGVQRETRARLPVKNSDPRLLKNSDPRSLRTSGRGSILQARAQRGALAGTGEV